MAAWDRPCTSTTSEYHHITPCLCAACQFWRSVYPCYTLASCAVFAEPMYTWPQNRACACLLSTHHSCLCSYCHHHHVLCIREFCVFADQINRTHFQVVSQGSLIYLIFRASTQSHAKIKRTSHYQSGGAFTTVPAVLGSLVHRHRKQRMLCAGNCAVGRPQLQGVGGSLPLDSAPPPH